jgi:hypothetical protein
VADERQNGNDVGLEVPGYHLRGCLARCESTSVHRAEAVGRPGRILVLKHLRTRPDPASLAGLRHVAEVVRGLDDPNILPLLDVVDTGSGIALVMPFAPGGSLTAAMDQAPAGLPPATVAEVGTRMAEGLAALHEHGVVHGAITADSVRFDARGRPLLADTGMVLLHDGRGSGNEPASADAPDRSAACDAAGDLRALGSMLAAALAGIGSERDHQPAGTARGHPTLDPAGSLDPAGDQTDHTDHTDAGITVSAPQPTATTPAEPAAVVVPRQAAPSGLVAAIDRALAAGTDHCSIDARQLAAALARAHEAALAAPAAAEVAETTAANTHRPTGARQTAAGTHRRTGARQTTGAAQRLTTAGTHQLTAVHGSAITRRRAPRSRVASVAAAGGVLLAPLVLVLTAIEDPPAIQLSPPVSQALDRSPPAPQAPDRSRPASQAPDRSPPAPQDPAGAEPRRPPPICTGLEAPSGDGAVLLADLEGSGCSTPVRWDGRQLAVATAQAAPLRYELLADGDDQLLFGDLSCDDRDAPILYRPGTGEVFVFDGLVAPGEETTVTGEPFGQAGGRAWIVTADDGCDRIEIDRQR